MNKILDWLSQILKQTGAAQKAGEKTLEGHHPQRRHAAIWTIQQLVRSVVILVFVSIALAAWFFCVWAVLTAANELRAYIPLSNSMRIAVAIGIALLVTLIWALLVVRAERVLSRNRTASDRAKRVSVSKLAAASALFVSGVGLGAWFYKDVRQTYRAALEISEAQFKLSECAITDNAKVASQCLLLYRDQVDETRLKAIVLPYINGQVKDADAAFARAADPVSGYTAATFAAALSAYKSISQEQLPVEQRRLISTRMNALSIGVEEFQDCDSCPKLRVVLPRDSSPPFAIGVAEISRAEWSGCSTCVKLPSSFLSEAEYDADFQNGLPVGNMRFTEVEQYLNFLGATTGSRYRLPTEREWRIALGDHSIDAGLAKLSRQSLCDFANLSNNDHGPKQQVPLSRNPNVACADTYWSTAAPSGLRDQKAAGYLKRFEPNALGIFHMLGNVSEWVDEACGKGEYVVMGGSFADAPIFDAAGRIVPERKCAAGIYGQPNRGFRVLRQLSGN
jgi:hypothetical protein